MNFKEKLAPILRPHFPLIHQSITDCGICDKNSFPFSITPEQFSFLEEVESMTRNYIGRCRFEVNAHVMHNGPHVSFDFWWHASSLSFYMEAERGTFRLRVPTALRKWLLPPHTVERIESYPRQFLQNIDISSRGEAFEILKAWRIVISSAHTFVRMELLGGRRYLPWLPSMTEKEMLCTIREVLAHELMDVARQRTDTRFSVYAYLSGARNERWTLDAAGNVREIKCLLQ